MLINLRNALTAGKRLPYQCELEYLEGTGTQWIDTGLNYFADFEIGVKLRESVPNVALGISSRRCMERINASNPCWRLMLDGVTWGSSARITDYHIMSWKNGVFAADGVTAQTVSNSFLSGTMTLFGAGGLYYPNMIYSCKLWDAQGNLVRDFIPVLDWNGNAKMFDRVTGTYPTHYGTFVAGPEIYPVEYIESHGTEYIDTGVKGSQNLRTTFDYQLIYSGTAPRQQGLFGCYSNGMKYHLYCSGTAPSVFQVGMGNDYINTIPVDNVRHSIEFNNGAVSVDNTVVATFAQYEYPTSYTLLLFALHNAIGGLYSMMPMRKWRVQMWDDGTPVRNFQPVRVGTDATSWEGAMMDVLTRRIYRNQGTGAFGYGNDLKYPIPAE